MTEKILVKYSEYFGRHGDLDGLFITTKEDLNNLIGKKIYFGEVLGKHSEVVGFMGGKNLTIVSEEQDFIFKLQNFMGSNTISGFNPFYYDEVEE